MRPMRYLTRWPALGVAAIAAVATLTVPSAHAAEPRAVSVAGALTEIVYALGAQNALVGVDTTSTFPEAATKLPQVGYQRTLSAEGILSLGPTVLFATPDAGPPEALAQLRAAKLPVLSLSADPTIEALEANIAAIAAHLGLNAEGERLSRRVRMDYDAVLRGIGNGRTPPRVLFLLNVGQGQLLVSGTGTKADAMIRLAGGANAVSAYTGYKPLSAEAMAVAGPELLLLTTQGLEASGGMDGLRKLPGVELTLAMQRGRVVHYDSLYLLGFGPRFPQALRELAQALHPGLAIPELASSGK